MATRTRTVRFEFEGDAESLKKELGALPGVTADVLDEIEDVLDRDVQFQGLRKELAALEGVSATAARKIAKQLAAADMEVEVAISDEELRKQLAELPGATAELVDQMAVEFARDLKLTGLRDELAELPGVTASAGRKIISQLDKSMREAADLEVPVSTEELREELERLPGATKKTVDAMLAEFERDAKLTGIRDELAKLPGVSASVAARMAKELEDGADKSKRAWIGLGDLIKAELAAGAIQEAARGLVEYQRELQKTRSDTIAFADATDIGLDTLGGLELAFQRSGRDFEKFRDSAADFGEVMFDFAEGGGRAEESFKLLDIAVQETDGTMRKVDDVFREVLTKLPQLANESQRVTVAQQFFSDAGLDAATSLRRIPLEKAIKDARELGTVLDDELVVATKNWDEANQLVRESLLDLSNSASFLPSIGELLLSLGVTFDFFKNVAVGALEVVGKQITGIGKTFLALITGDIRGALDEASIAFGSPFQDAFDIIDGAAEKTAQRLKDIRGAVESIEGEVGVTFVGPTIDDAELAKRLTEEERDLAEAKRESVAASKEAQRASEQAAAAELSALSARRGALQTIADIRAAATDDLLTDEDRIQAAFDDRIKAILRVSGANVSAAQTSRALDEADERRTRDLTALDLERSETLIEIERETAAAIKEIRDDQFERTLRQTAEVASAIGTIQGTISGLSAALGAAGVKAAEDQVAASQEAISSIDAQMQDAFQKQDQTRLNSLKVLKEAEEVKARRAADLLTAAFRQQQRADRASAVIGSAVNAIRLVPAFAFAGPFAPALAAGVAGAQLATQLAAIGGQQAPSATFDHGGIIGTRGTSPDQVTITGQPGESMLNRDTTERLGQEGVDRLNNGGGAGNVTVNVLLDRRIVQTVVVDAIRGMMQPAGPSGGRIQLFNGG